MYIVQEGKEGEEGLLPLYQLVVRQEGLSCPSVCRYRMCRRPAQYRPGRSLVKSSSILGSFSIATVIGVLSS